jgi:hypothetical protein
MNDDGDVLLSEKLGESAIFLVELPLRRWRVVTASSTEERQGSF